MITELEIGTETCGLDSVVAADDLGFCSDTERS